jgi:hypothetical protein
MPSYLVKSPLQTGGKLYKVGSTVELPADVAASLVSRGRLEELKNAEAAPKGAASKASKAPKPPKSAADKD